MLLLNPPIWPPCRLSPDFMDARVNLAKVYSDSRQFSKAAQAFLTAYELSDPRQADYLYYSAVMGPG